MEAYRRFKTKEFQPEVSGWYGTDKGELYWFANERVWSCRNDRISEERPDVWYSHIKELSQTYSATVEQLCASHPNGHSLYLESAIYNRCIHAIMRGSNPIMMNAV